MRPVITFLTDFGPSAPAVCRGVMFTISPDANIIDINHQVPRYSIRSGAGSLVFALKHMPVGAGIFGRLDEVERQLRAITNPRDDRQPAAGQIGRAHV